MAGQKALSSKKLFIRERIFKMGLFNKKRNEDKDFKLETVSTRLDVLAKEKELMADFNEELVKDLRDFAVANDMIDEETIELIPVLKKYGKKLDNFMELSYTAAEIEIVKNEKLEEAIVSLESDIRGVKNELANTNKILEKIAKNLEKK